MKVVFLISHIPPYDVWKANNHTPRYNWKSEKGELVGFDGTGWGDQILEQIIKVIEPGVSFEVWQPDFRTEKVLSATLDSGLVHRLFPAIPASSKVTYLGGKKEFHCPEMCNLVEENLKSGEQLLLHSFLNSRYNTRILLDKFADKAPFLFQAATNIESHLYFGSNIKRNIKQVVQNLVLNKYFGRIKNLFTGSNLAVNFRPGVNYFKHEGLSNIGVDFSSLAIDMSKEQAKTKLGLSVDDFVIFSSQRLIPEKQVDELLVAAAKIKDLNFKLIISGSGNEEYQNKLLSLCQDLNLEDKVKFVGYISGETLNCHYKASDLFVSTSRSEAGPDSVYKAIAFNLPIAYTDTGIAYEFLNDNDAGVILKKDDSSNWAVQLENSIRNIGEVKVVSEAKWNAFFDWTNVANYYAKVYRQIVNDFYEGTA